MISKSQALLSLCPGAEWIIDDQELIWLDKNQSKPTEEEIQQELQRLQVEYEYNEYQRQRAQEYPSIAEQFDLLYHGGYDAWKVEIDKIKDKYPKPE